jgi:ferredoxin
MQLKIDYKKCCWKDEKCSSCGCGGTGKACVGCVEVCPVGALVRKKKLEVDIKKCLACGACVGACKHNALSLK